jgi:hypothetical protein
VEADNTTSKWAISLGKKESKDETRSER